MFCKRLQLSVELVPCIRVPVLKFRSIKRMNATANVVSEPLTESNQFDVLEDIITPLARTSYDQQLKVKNDSVMNCIRYLRGKVGNFDVDVRPILPSPVTEHYRSKDEFNVRKGINGEKKVFGFFTGKHGTGEIYAVRPTNLINVKEEHKQVLTIFEEFVKNSPLPACYSFDDGGYWRNLTLRSNLKGEVMAVTTVHPQKRDVREIVEESFKLAEHFITNGVNLHSLYYVISKHVKSTIENSVISLAHGSPYLYETFMGKVFRISPTSFFQINVKAAELLHEEIIKIANVNDSTTLLDLCCGVGTFSLSFNNLVRNTVGIDDCQSSINDALENCKSNEVFNCEFTLGKVEERLNSIFRCLNNTGNLTVIANPGRSGLHPRAIELLRTNPFVKKIIYVSCDPFNSKTITNFEELMISPKKSKDPKKLKKQKKQVEKKFYLTHVVPVDMFPHTRHYELVLFFQRE